jgi:hypothetical protein
MIESQKIQTLDERRKEQNYAMLLNTISFLENGGNITEDWMEENKDKIILYREYFEDFSRVNLEIEDSAFRKLANETEIMMAYLYMEVTRNHTFTVGLFLQLNKHILQLITTVNKDNDLSDMFNNMGLK